MPPRKHPANEQDLRIRAEYEAGGTTTGLATDYSTTASAIIAAIRRAGGKLRSRSEAGNLRYARERERAAGASDSIDSLPLSSTGQKRCSGCLLVKPLSEFGKDRGARDGYDTRCKECDRNRFRRWIANHDNSEAMRQRWRDDKLLRDFGITRDQYNAMLNEQGGLCAVCRQPETALYRGRLKMLAVDHDHISGKIRQLCCSSCNTGLGGFRDSIPLLQAAIEYLRKHGAEG